MGVTGPSLQTTWGSRALFTNQVGVAGPSPYVFVYTDVVGLTGLRGTALFNRHSVEPQLSNMPGEMVFNGFLTVI